MRFSRYAWPSESESGGQTAQVSAAVGWKIPGGNLNLLWFFDGSIPMGSIVYDFFDGRISMGSHMFPWNDPNDGSLLKPLQLLGPPTPTSKNLLCFKACWWSPRFMFGVTTNDNWLVVTGTWLLFFHILGMSSSQLTHIFERGRSTTNQRKCDKDQRF